ncbi:major facilitator superfamily transporter [Infundibulicybe gibba]|nr:major facilitator superfamily transporter [Infundibulicybe gibba]
MNDDNTSDEETVLLAHTKKDYKPTPLPKVQIGIVLLLEFCDPLPASQYPHILSSELDITGGDKRKVGYYAGLLESLFRSTEIIMVMQWSRISDHIGRKPVLFIGLAGMSASILLFGLSRSFWTLSMPVWIVGREHWWGHTIPSSVAEMRTGIMKTMIGELTDSSNRARGFSLIPAVWAVGATLGPLIGGTFARPHERFPQVFGGQFWQDYPYFLPCLAVASVICISFIITLLFLNETVPERIRGRRCSSLASRGVIPIDAPSIRSHGGPLPLRDLLVYPVIISISNYAALVFFDAMLYALLPLFLAMPIHIGGLGFEPLILSSHHSAVRRTAHFSWGPNGILPIFLLFPVMSAIAQRSGVNLVVWAIIGVLLSLMVCADLTYGCIYIYVTASSPNRRSLGATNGLSQMGASVARATGPVLATSLFSFSMEKNLLGGYAVYAVLFCISCLVIFKLAVLLPEKVWEDKGDDSSD